MPVRIVQAAEGIAEAVTRLRAGKLVAFPTETVYGLGANALDAEAVAQIFAVKGRPATNPLIVHVADREAAQRLAARWSPVANELATQFWPGPLTLVVEKTEAVPNIVTAGGSTVGLRVPDHPVARDLLRLSGVAVAAPSANRSEEVSPTTAQHVADSLGPFTDDLLILDGGACRVGLESTVVDITGETPRTLRPGALRIAEFKATSTETESAAPARSPGQMLRHYAPRARLLVIPTTELEEILKREEATGRLHIGLIVRQTAELRTQGGRTEQMPRDAAGYGARLYATLREMDRAGVDCILLEEPPHDPEWDAVHDRLRRAAA